MRLAFLLSICLLNLLVYCQTTSNSKIVRDVDNYVSALAKKDSFSGIVLLGLNDKILYHKSYGLASKEYNVPITTGTRFDLASMGKMFTGVAIGLLVQEGKLNFTDPVDKYLPELPANLTRGITIHHLLTHTAGLGSFWRPAFHDGNHAAFRELKDYLPLIINDTLAFQPGARWAYSNAGYLVLGLLIEKISGQSYFDFVQNRIFQNAAMNASAFLERDAVNKNVATGYTKNNRYRRSDQSYTNTHYIGPVKGSSAGGAYSTAEDMFKFSRALINNKLLQVNNTRTIIEGKAPYDRPERNKKYAYGFAEQYVNGKRIVFHDGGANGISTQMDIYPELGYTVVVLSNYDAPAAMLVANYLRGVLTK